MADDLWVPTQTKQRMERPTARKTEGGSYFDDELSPEETRAKAYASEVEELLQHLNQRPDHVVFVGSAEERGKMREVFNWWRKAGALMCNPNIRIDYGVPEGAIRLGEDRS